MTKSTRARILAAVAGMLAVPLAASAELVHFQFSGVLEEVTDPAGITDAAVGDAWQYAYSFDSDSVVFDAREGRFEYHISSEYLEFGDTQVSSLYSFINGIYNDDPVDGDTYFVSGIDRGWIGGNVSRAVLSVRVTLQDIDGLAFDGVTPLTSPIDLSLFESAMVEISGYELQPHEDFSYTGVIQSWTLVPEPSSLALLVATGLCMGRRRR